MGITPHGVLISNAFETKPDVRRRDAVLPVHGRAFFDYSIGTITGKTPRGQFIPRDDVPARECGRDNAGVSLDSAAEHFMRKMGNE